MKTRPPTGDTRKKQPRIKTPESGVLRACLDLLAAEKIWHCRMNSGAFLPRGVGKGIVRAGKPGLADILASVPVWMNVNDGEYFKQYPAFLWIECKSDSGQQSVDQRSFQMDAELAGHKYIVVRSSDDLKAWLKAQSVTE